MVTPLAANQGEIFERSQLGAAWGSNFRGEALDALRSSRKACSAFTWDESGAVVANTDSPARLTIAKRFLANEAESKHGLLTKAAKRPRLHRDDERSRHSEMLRENGRQFRRGPT